MHGRHTEMIPGMQSNSVIYEESVDSRHSQTHGQEKDVWKTLFAELFMVMGLVHGGNMSKYIRIHTLNTCDLYQL